AARDVRRLLRDSESRFTELRLPIPFDIDTFVRFLSQRRRRPIHLVPLALGAAQPSGMTLVLSEMDIVCYEAETSWTHQEHIIAHELAHIMCGHTGTASVGDDVARVLFPNLDPALVRDMLNRTDHGDEYEWEAEVMASVILRRMNAQPNR